jgi:hypothetical protein
VTRRPAGTRAALILLVALPALPPASVFAGSFPLPARSEGEVTPYRSIAHPSAAPRLYSTGDTLTLYSENLESFSSPGSEGGWTHVDKSGQPTAWHIAPDFACEGNSFWCGVVDSSWTADPDRKGYGNGWIQQASNYVDLTGAASPVTLGFKQHLNVETGYDFARVQVLDPDQGWVTLGNFTGVIDPSGAAICDTFSVQIPDTIIAKSAIVAFQFEFVSDVSGSSADGLYPNADGWSVDNVTVVSGLSDVRFFDDFEAGLGTWSRSSYPSVGDLWRIVTNGATEQYCSSNTTKTWTCAGLTSGALLPRANDVLQSPRIPLTSADQVLLSFDVYRNLSLSACFYYRAEFRSRKTTDPGWSAWTDPSGLLYFGNEKEWVRQQIPLVGAGGADSVQFRITAADYGALYCDGTSTATGTLLLLDNFALQVIGLAGPSITANESDLFQDTFKTTPFYADDNINTPKGDSLVVRVAASRGLKSASFFSSLNGAAFVATPLTKVGGSATNAYYADMPSGSYPRGTVIRYYLSATDSLDEVATLPADAVAASHYFSVSVLPAIQAASGFCAGDSARILYVNSEAPIDGTPGIAQGLAAIGARYDRYDVNAAASGLGNALGGGDPLDPNRVWPAVPAGSLAAYSTIVWDVGDRSDVTLSPQDQTLLRTWLGTAGRNRNLLLAGDNLAFDLVVNGRGIANFLSCDIGATFIRDDWESSPQDSLFPVLVGAPGTKLAPSPFPLNGGCPTVNRFEAIAVSTCAGANGRNWILYPNQLAAATERRAAIGTPGGDSVRTILAGFTLGALSSAAQRNLLLWRTLHEEFEEPYCSIPTAVLDPPSGAPRVLARLLGAAPNPFNPQTTIRVELTAPTRARLVLFDVQGRLVRVLADGPQSAGHHEIAWDGRDANGRDVATGTYFYRLEAGGNAWARKLTLLR